MTKHIIICVLRCHIGNENDIGIYALTRFKSYNTFSKISMHNYKYKSLDNSYPVKGRISTQ